MDWKLWFRFEKMSQNETTLQTSEVAKNWTEHSPKSKLNQINAKLNSAKSNEAKELKNLISRREYRQFQKKIWITSFSDLDWKLGARTLDSFNAYLEKIEKTNTTINETTQNTQNLRDYIYQDYVHRPEYQQLSESAKIHKASREYLSRHESMSESDYNKIFSWKEQLAQWQLGNCYLVSSLIELANTQYFDVLMRTSISRVQFKDDWSRWYNIRIPLWEPDGRDILIKDSEIKMASVRWNDGYKLLELAYVKNKRKNDKEWNRYAPVSQWEMDKTTWWWPNEVFRTFLGNKNIWFSDFGTWYVWDNWQTLSVLPQSKKNEITNYLRNFNPKTWNTFTNLATGPSKNGDRDSFQVWRNVFYKEHAYALSSVDKDSQWNVSYVNVKNPRNNEKKAWGADMRLSLDDFWRAFSYIGVWKVDTDNFLDEKWWAYNT